MGLGLSGSPGGVKLSLRGEGRRRAEFPREDGRRLCVFLTPPRCGGMGDGDRDRDLGLDFGFSFGEGDVG